MSRALPIPLVAN